IRAVACAIWLTCPGDERNRNRPLLALGRRNRNSRQLHDATSLGAGLLDCCSQSRDRPLRADRIRRPRGDTDRAKRAEMAALVRRSSRRLRTRFRPGPRLWLRSAVAAPVFRLALRVRSWPFLNRGSASVAARVKDEHQEVTAREQISGSSERSAALLSRCADF